MGVSILIERPAVFTSQPPDPTVPGRISFSRGGAAQSNWYEHLLSRRDLQVSANRTCLTWRPKFLAYPTEAIHAGATREYWEERHRHHLRASVS